MTYKELDPNAIYLVITNPFAHESTFGRGRALINGAWEDREVYLAGTLSACNRFTRVATPRGYMFVRPITETDVNHRDAMEPMAAEPRKTGFATTVDKERDMYFATGKPGDLKGQPRALYDIIAEAGETGISQAKVLELLPAKVQTKQPIERVFAWNRGILLEKQLIKRSLEN